MYTPTSDKHVALAKDMKSSCDKNVDALLEIKNITHNHAVNPARPPATTDDGISFDKTAGLKRFHSHSHQLHTFSHNAGWEGGLSKITRSIVLDQNSNNRNCTRDLDPPTHQKQCKFVRLTPLRSVRHHNLVVNPARPPATTDDGISFDRLRGSDSVVKLLGGRVQSGWCRQVCWRHRASCCCVYK